MTNVRYGIVACGAIAQRRHIPEISRNPNAQVVAVTDPLEDRAEAVAKEYEAKAYTDHNKMFEKEELDAVVVCTPNVLHAPVTVDAFEAGYHVLVEKPMATTREDGRRMIEAGRKAGKFLMVGMNQRFGGPHIKAKEVLDSGRLGKPLCFETTFKHRGPDGWSIDGAHSWFFNKEKAVMGVTGDLGVHKADLLRWLLGEEFTRVGGFITTLDKRHPDTNQLILLDDNAFVSVETASGTIGSINISWTNYGGEGNATRIYCANGVMEMGGSSQFSVSIKYKNGQGEYHDVGKLATNTSQTGSGVSNEFTACILENRPPSIDGEEGYAAINIILTAMEAAESGRIEPIHA